MSYFRQSGNFHFEEDLFSKIAQSIDLIMHEALVIFKVLQTMPQFKIKTMKYFVLYFTINKNSSDDEGENWDLR